MTQEKEKEIMLMRERIGARFYKRVIGNEDWTLNESKDDNSLEELRGYFDEFADVVNEQKPPATFISGLEEVIEAYKKYIIDFDNKYDLFEFRKSSDNECFYFFVDVRNKVVLGIRLYGREKIDTSLFFHYSPYLALEMYTVGMVFDEIEDNIKDALMTLRLTILSACFDAKIQKKTAIITTDIIAPNTYIGIILNDNPDDIVIIHESEDKYSIYDAQDESIQLNNKLYEVYKIPLETFCILGLGVNSYIYLLNNKKEKRYNEMIIKRPR